MAAESPEQQALRAMFGAAHFSDLLVARRDNRRLRDDYERRIDQERDALHNALREDHHTELERYRDRCAKLEAEVARLNTQVRPPVRPPLAHAPTTTRAPPTNSHTTLPTTRRRSASASRCRHTQWSGID